MKILGSSLLAKAAVGARVFLGLHEIEYEHNGKDHSYFMVTRGDAIVSPEEKRPDAVVIVGLVGDTSESCRIVITREFRVPLGCMEYGFPAGLIDAADYEGGKTVREAAFHAAIREFKEETGLTFVPQHASPPNLYSSAGMTNESCIIVFGTATGTPSKAFLEPTEDIAVMLMSQTDLQTLTCNDKFAFSKVSWPLMYMMSVFGFSI